MSDYRHVCFKDLENYIKRSDYFGDYTEVEKNQIRKNLSIPTIEDLKETQTGVVEGTYEEIKNIADNNQLNLSGTYIINDFQTIYLSNTGEVWGLDVNPSQLYSVILTPISPNAFSKDVVLLSENKALDWIVRYDFKQDVINNIKTKGKITYLQDQNGNSAYFDFKNIKFRVYLDAYDVTALTQSSYFDLYTFSKYQDGTFVDRSEDSEIANNQFDQNCYNNVFLGITNNNHFYGGFKNNIFIKNCTNNKFEWDTAGNKFIGNITYTQGSIKNAVVETSTFDSAISKEFKMVHSQTSADPVFVVTYLDGDTLTNQVIKLNKNT